MRAGQQAELIFTAEDVIKTDVESFLLLELVAFFSVVLAAPFPENALFVCC